MAATDSLPRFFKIFLSHFSSHSMVIPVSYYDELPLGLPKTALLQGIGGCFWNVSLMKKRGEVYFGKGWAKFVEDNCLRDGDVLTFAYDGYRNFEVSIYGSGGCKEARAVAEVIYDSEDSVSYLSSEDTNTSSEPEVAKTVPKTRNKEIFPRKEKVMDVSDESEDSNSSDSSYSPLNEDTIPNVRPEVAYSKKKGKSKPVKAVGSTSNSAHSVSRKKESNKIKNLEVYLDDPKNVHFVTIVKNRTYELFIHAQLVKDYGLKFQDYVYFIDNYGKLEARAAKWQDQRVCIKRWNHICKRNRLKKGDRILCEIFRNQCLVYAIKIHIIAGI